MVKEYKRLNTIFRSMKTRCYNPNCIEYSNYGGRGITICDEWLNSERVKTLGRVTKGWLAFKEWALLNGYQDNLSIDRIDNNKGYSPDNCRWADSKTQANNRGDFVFKITYKNRTQTLKQWCEELGLKYQTILKRIQVHHWSVEKALETKTDAREKLITYKNESKSLTQWCKELGLDYRGTHRRIYRLHWSLEKAFETKIMGKYTKR